MRRWWGVLPAVLLYPATALAAEGHEAFSWFELLHLPVPQYIVITSYSIHYTKLYDFPPEGYGR